MPSNKLYGSNSATPAVVATALREATDAYTDMLAQESQPQDQAGAPGRPGPVEVEEGAVLVEYETANLVQGSVAPILSRHPAAPPA